MSKTIVIAVCMALIGAPAALAQATNDGLSGPSGSNAAKPSPYNNAPVGHRQPRVSDIPPEARDATENPPKADPADAALDRKIKSICRGC
ncbi:MAG TPA: hypothetical protein VFS91_08815 [Nitrobacter sp.]|nr:hypothetical protein [Nitrobacter sp.]